ncbi:MAG: DUF4954 family protein [Spirochaetaceae bacterium]
MKQDAALRFPFVFEQIHSDLLDQSLPVQPDVIESLQSLGNTSDDWSLVRVRPGAVLTGVTGCHFSGHCVLGSRVSLRHTVFHDVAVDDDVRVHGCTTVRGYYLSARSVVEGSVLDHDRESLFGNDLAVPPAVEMSPYRVRLCAGMDWRAAVAALGGTADMAVHESAAADLVRQIDQTRGYVGAGAEIRGGAIVRRSYIGAGRVIEGAFTIEDSTLLGSFERGTAACRGGGIIRRSILAPEAWVGDFGHCSESMLFDRSSVDRGGQLSLSVLGYRTEVSQAEVTASVLGPLVGVHHKSLLIACMWPSGLGNVGSGAQVGSNHTSRLPDQSMIGGEGMFFGLATAIKFPANYRESPYSVVATGLITAPQTVRFPFSLLTTLGDPPSDTPVGYNRIMPGWVISHNFFSLLRNELKFARRLGSTAEAVKVIRAETAEMVREALSRLDSISEPDEWYYDGTIPGIGRNVLLESDRRRGIAAYRDFLAYFDLRASIENGTRVSREQLAEGTDLLDRLRAKARDSRARDFHRGVRIFSEYRQTHPEPDEDPELHAVLAILDQEQSSLLRLGPE